MSADELEDYLELKNPKVKAAIAASRKSYARRKSSPAATLLAELKKGAVRKSA
jgi:hypothetical protein